MSSRTEEFQAACSLVEDCLREGCTEVWIPGPGNRTAVHEAAQRWRKPNGGGSISVKAFKELIDRAKQEGIEPDWSAFRPRQYLHRPPGLPVIPPQDHTAADDPQGEPIRCGIIGDAHDSPHLRDKSRFRWLGAFIEEHGFERCISVGDWLTMDSFSSHTDRATFAGLAKPTFAQDLESFHESQRAFHDGLAGHKPKKDITLGNHENRARNYDNQHPDGVAHSDLLEQAFAQWGWRTTPYKQYRFFAGVGVTHIPTNALGRALTESQRPNKAMFDTIHGDDHRSTMRTDFKTGPVRSPTVYSAATALPPGYIEGFASDGGSAWRSGACSATLWGGFVRQWNFTEMCLLKRRYGRPGEGEPRTISGWAA